MSEELKEKIRMYMRSREFFWNHETIAEFRAWHAAAGYGTFGSSPACWNTAIKKAISHENITI